MKNGHELVLVLGIDGSGKSTLLNGLSSNLGYLALEATSTKEAKEFKRQHAGQPLDLAFVHERRDLFHTLNSTLAATISEELVTGNVATSGLRIVTDISHAVMGRVIANETTSIPRIVDEWMATDEIKPDKVVLVHAPMNVIQQRILERQRSGVSGEEMTGFNSSFFLGHYQDALCEAVDTLSTCHDTLTIDTSKHAASELVELYVASKYN